MYYQYRTVSELELTGYLTAWACVCEDTIVMMADGTTKAVQNITDGDILLTYDENNNKFDQKQVTNVNVGFKSDIIKIIFDNNVSIRVTSGHPILTIDGWASYNTNITNKKVLPSDSLIQLKPGQLCPASDGSYLTIMEIIPEDVGETKVYDLALDGAHTFCGSNSVNDIKRPILLGPSCHPVTR
jgi:intein/homing endonuclease